MICSAPAVRKTLVQLNGGHTARTTAPAFLVVNGTLLVVCIIAVCLAYLPGRLNGLAYLALKEGYTGLKALIARGRTEQNLAVLASATQYMDLFGELAEMVSGR